MFPNPQDALPLPPRPNLEQYKRLAKELVKACKSANPDAIGVWSSKWIETLVRLASLTITPQFPVQIECWVDQVKGFAHAKLSHSESAPCALADAQFVIARSHGFESWRKFAQHIDAVSRKSSPVSNFEAAADAIVEGDISTLDRLLREEPELIRTRSTREHRATLLHYVSANGVEGYRQKTPKHAVKVAEILLNAGAEVDATADVYGGGATTLGLVATSVHPERAGVQNALMQILLDYGAVIDHPQGAGNKSCAVIGCLHNDRPRAAEFLAAHGARLNLEGAAGVGRLDVVKSFFNGDGTLRPNATKAQLQSAFIWATEYGRKEVVEFLLDKGIDLRAGENIDETALHLAAHRGQLEMIKLLLDRGAPLEAKNVYGGTVLGQATWSVIHGDPSIDFVPVIEELLAAGAKIEEADYPTGNERVDEVLRRHRAKS
jgi:Ankyrin repeats (3 copies)